MYTSKDVLFHTQNTYFIVAMMNEVEAHEAISHWTLMKRVKSKININTRTYVGECINGSKDSKRHTWKQ